MKRAQIRVDLFGEIAGQEAELLARLDGGAGQDDAAHPSRVEHMHGHRHGKVGLAGSGRSHGKDHFVAAQRFQIGALGCVAGGDGLLGQGEHGLVTERAAQIRTRIALKELEPLLQIGTLERVPAAQQAVKLGEQIQDAFAQRGIIGRHGQRGSPGGEIRSRAFGDDVEVGVVRSEQGIGQCRVIKGQGFHKGR